MGHASVRTTLDTFGHLFPGLDEAAADALDESFRGVAVELKPSAHSGRGLQNQEILCTTAEDFSMSSGLPGLR